MANEFQFQQIVAVLLKVLKMELNFLLVDFRSQSSKLQQKRS